MLCLIKISNSTIIATKLVYISTATFCKSFSIKWKNVYVDIHTHITCKQQSTTKYTKYTKQQSTHVSNKRLDTITNWL